MHSVYVLLMSNGQLYIGSTPDLRSRIQKHSRGEVLTTKRFLPITLIYNESYASKEDALDREQKLKHYGSAYRGLCLRIERSILEQRNRRG